MIRWECSITVIPRRNDEESAFNLTVIVLKSRFLTFVPKEVIVIDEQNVRHPEPVEGCEINLTAVPHPSTELRMARLLVFMK